MERKDIADLGAAKAKALPADVLRVVNAQIKASEGSLAGFHPLIPLSGLGGTGAAAFGP